jgi:hypothetical protein
MGYFHIQRERSKKNHHSNYILNSRHTYGTVVNTMDVRKTGRKGKNLNT